MSHPLETTLAHAFRDPALLQAALIHPSVASSASASYERMEFLGDSVLGLVIAQAMYERFPAQAEGDLTQMKSEIVSRRACAEVAQAIGLVRHMTLGKGVDARGVAGSVAAAGIEAVIGALYLDGGLEPARAFILKHFESQIESASASTHRNNWKAILQQWAQKKMSFAPAYRILATRGPEHAKEFEIEASLGERRFPPARAQVKKMAEMGAALNALLELGVVKEDGGQLVVNEP